MDDDNVEVLSLALKKLDLIDRVTFIKKSAKAGRKMIPHEIRRKIWHFWHTSSMASTLTSKPAKLRVSNRKKTENGQQSTAKKHCTTKKQKLFSQPVVYSKCHNQRIVFEVYKI